MGKNRKNLAQFIFAFKIDMEMEFYYNDRHFYIGFNDEDNILLEEVFEDEREPNITVFDDIFDLFSKEVIDNKYFDDILFSIDWIET